MASNGSVPPSTIHYDSCPACGSVSLQVLWPVRDFSVSGEEFTLVQCDQCGLRFTQDVPDQEHIGRYYKSANYISHSNTRKGLINRLYHLVRNRTLQSKRRLVESMSRCNTGRLLDIGAGVGAFASVMKSHGWEVTGLEPDTDARARAASEYGIVLLDNSALSQLPSGSFQAITLWHVLEHVHALQDYLQQFYRLLAPGGVLIIAVPNYESDDARYYGAYWAAYDVPRHLYHFSRQSMEQLLLKNNLPCIRQLPMIFDSYYVSLLSNQYQSGHSNWLKALWRGWRSNRKAGKRGTSSVIYIAGKM